ncbi:unnamed protein product, partial [Rotaria sp. Silwood1]
GTDFSTFGADLGSVELLGSGFNGVSSYDLSSYNVLNNATIRSTAFGATL